MVLKKDSNNIMFKNTQYKFGETNEVSDMPLLIELTFQKNFKQIKIEKLHCLNLYIL